MRTIKNRNTSGRPKKSDAEKRGRIVCVKFDKRGYETLAEKAHKAGMNISEFIRNALQRSEVKERLNPEHLSYILQLIGMANNLNQVARKANTIGFRAIRIDIEQLARQMDSVIKLIKRDS